MSIPREFLANISLFFPLPEFSKLSEECNQIIGGLSPIQFGNRHPLNSGFGVQTNSIKNLRLNGHTSFESQTRNYITCFVQFLKNHNLNLNELKNYRPVSNLPYLSKIVEKVVAHRLEIHLDSCNLQSPMQSAYMKYHSIETAMLLVHNDIIKSLDDGKLTVWLQLDLSAAFDTVDHVILLQTKRLILHL